MAALAIATKPNAVVGETEKHPFIIVLPSDPSEEILAIASELRAVAVADGRSVDNVTWPSALPAGKSTPVIVSLLEFENSFISDLSEIDYDVLKTLVLSGKRLLWIAKGSGPVMQTATGFIRSLSNENSGADYSFVLFEEGNTRDAVDMAKVIHQLVHAEVLEKEYMEKSGELHCSRWTEKRALSAMVGAADEASSTETIVLSSVQGSLTLTEQKNDRETKVLFTGSERFTHSLADHEVEIEIISLLLR